MRSFWAGVIIFVLLAVLVLPAAVIGLMGGARGPAPEAPEAARADEGPLLKVFVAARGEVEEMPLERYLVGVTAAEMPAEFHPEALKAQAVAARTYALRRLKSFGGAGCLKHPEADICTDPACCQGWLSESELRQRWGLFSYPHYHEKIAEAVAATAGLVITYDHELIDPVYHASCGGLGTEDAAAVWGSSVPYLRHVECNFDGNPPHMGDEVTFTLAELGERLGLEVAVPASQGLDLAVLSRTAAGRVKELRAGRMTLSGPEVRKRLGLNSTNFSWRLAEGGKVVFTTSGNGHAVGLCQYGANGLAKAGRDFRAILQHYYTGTTVSPPPGSSGSGINF
ncbi:MAG: stage sporulation protein [Bacillota bacterium]|nr:stage sporulation protein [Bacillota bacterium]